MKKLLSLVTALALTFLTLADTEVVNGIEWNYTILDGKASIYNNGFAAIPTSTSGAITIPSTLGGCPVVTIGDSAFYGCGSLTSVTIPEGVTSIGLNAFWQCNSLTNVTLPSSVILIGTGAFGWCESLTSVTIPQGVTRIEQNVFCNCFSLTSVTIPENVTSIGMYAFCNCTNLTSIVISDSVTIIGDYTFYECDKLTSVVVPDGVITIASAVFYGCDSLISVEIPPSVTTIGFNAFTDCNSLKTICVNMGDITRIKGLYSWPSGVEFIETYIRGIKYLQDEFDDIGKVTVEDGFKVTVTNDVTKGIVLPDNLGDVTIDLNGHNIIGGDGEPAIKVVKGDGSGDVTELTIIDSKPDATDDVIGGVGSAAIVVTPDANSDVLINIGEGVGVRGGDGVNDGPGGAGIEGNVGTNDGTISGGGGNPPGVAVTGDIGGGSGTTAKIPLEVPAATTNVYNGATQKSTLAETAFYTVSGNDGWVEVGTYSIMLTLKDSNNYCWPNNTTSITNTTFTIVAPLKPKLLPDPIVPAGAFNPTKAVTQTGIIADEATGLPKATVQVKVGKANKKCLSKITVTVIDMDGKKYSSKATQVNVGAAPVPVEIFVKKWEGGKTLKFNIANNGFGLENVMMFADSDTRLGDASMLFTAEDMSLFKGVQEKYLPTDVKVTRTVKKWITPKAGKLKYVKANASKGIEGHIEETDKTGEKNFSALKFTYTPKKSTFKGSFKVWTFDEEKKKLKGTSAKITGIVAAGDGYGKAVVKKTEIGKIVVK